LSPEPLALIFKPFALTLASASSPIGMVFSPSY
jgi:hypothetical protein